MTGYSLRHIIVKCIQFLVCVSLFSNIALGRIQFQNISVEEAIRMAKEQNKLVFIDTYATWCAPCKVMDRVFNEDEVSTYFNNNFINLKIDMDGLQGDKMLYGYEVVWLPTLLIIDGSGNLRTKIDRLISGNELLSYAKSAVAGMHINATSSLSSTPFAGTSPESREVQDYDPNDKAEVIYVYDEKASSGRPHIMYHEAYLHLQLMDGQHQKVVKKYLSTQSNWSTEKNVRFIFDFIQSTRSPEFDYLINNRPRFDEIIGQEKVTETIGILVNQRLNKGFPRPELIEAHKLFSYLDPSKANQFAYDYYLNRLLLENKTESYLTEALDYLENVNPYDIPVICKYVELELASERSSDYNGLMTYLNQAILIEENNPEIHYLFAQIYYNQKDKTNAANHIAKAVVLVDPTSEQLEKYAHMQGQIESML